MNRYCLIPVSYTHLDVYKRQQYEGRNYLVWGSFRGIYVIELTADGLSIMPGAKKKRIAGTAFEAV